MQEQVPRAQFSRILETIGNSIYTCQVMMNLHNSYFAIKNPLHIIERWRHPFRFRKVIDFHGKALCVAWTGRAEREVNRRQAALIVEMQIYFSCVVQKRVLFHDHTDLPTQDVDSKFKLMLRPVEAASCDPVAFANHHPVSHEYTSKGAQGFRPSRLELDFKDGQWTGTFEI